MVCGLIFLVFFFSLAEDGSVMDVDTYPTQSTPASHQCVLDALSAVCTEVSVVCEVIPRVIEHAQKLCKGMIQ